MLFLSGQINLGELSLYYLSPRGNEYRINHVGEWFLLDGVHHHPFLPDGNLPAVG